MLCGYFIHIKKSVTFLIKNSEEMRDSTGVLQDSSYQESRAEITSAVSCQLPQSKAFPFRSAVKDAISYLFIVCGLITGDWNLYARNQLQLLNIQQCVLRPDLRCKCFLSKCSFPQNMLMILAFDILIMYFTGTVLHLKKPNLLYIQKNYCKPALCHKELSSWTVTGTCLMTFWNSL